MKRLLIDLDPGTRGNRMAKEFPKGSSDIPSKENYPKQISSKHLIGFNKGISYLVDTPEIYNDIELQGEVTGSGSLGSPVATTITNKNITLDGDIAGFGQLGSNITTTISNKTVTLGGDLSGSGDLGTTINATIDNKSIELTGDVTATGTLGSSMATTIANKNITFTGAITGSGTLGGNISTSFSYPINGGGNRIENVSNPVNSQDVATKNYVDSSGGTPSTISDITQFQGNSQVYLKYGTDVNGKGPGRQAVFLTWDQSGDVGYIAVWEDGCQIINSSDTWNHIIRFVDEDVYPDPSQPNNYSAAIDSSGNYIQNSSQRIKRNITPYEEASLEKIAQLKLKEFNFVGKEHKENQEKTFGLIAEETEEILPNVVEGGSAINMSHLQMHMLKAIQELNEIVNKKKWWKIWKK